MKSPGQSARETRLACTDLQPTEDMLKEADRAPDFTGQTDSGATISLKSLRGQTVVLYFYPKDDTPG